MDPTIVTAIEFGTELGEVSLRHHILVAPDHSTTGRKIKFPVECDMLDQSSGSLKFGL